MLLLSEAFWTDFGALPPAGRCCCNHEAALRSLVL